ncbi:MAG TPA: DUF4339 domain-containing protein [Microthrixaceae bacterium]|nr:DUF4339 domain-containing protein [Microthrixaceae bacterium]HNI35966.1 DUF4339 domain-containing protein [Microthrixaceae bacterium]
MTADGNQVGPEPLQTVVDRVRAGQVGPDVNVWWPEASGWMPLNTIPEAMAMLTGVASGPVDSGAAPAASAMPAAPAGAADALMSGLSDQELDDEFMGLLKRSWELYKETELATSIDEAVLGGIVTALVDCGFVVIDIETAGAPIVTGATAAPTASVDVATAGLPAPRHQLRLEAPDTGARVTVALEHLTPDAGSAKLLGQLAAVVIGYGERVPNFSQVSQALRQEVASAFVASPEPGTVSWDADLGSSYVFAQIDLLLELEKYVSSDLAVDHELLRRHLAAVVNTLRTFVRSRFGS